LPEMRVDARHFPRRQIELAEQKSF
jgi:hypothetical protein